MTDTANKIPVKSEKKSSMPGGFMAGTGSWEPFETLRHEIDQIFDRLHEPFFRSPFGQPSFPSTQWMRDGSFGLSPAVDVVENEKDYEITVELPGLDEKHIEVKIANGALMIRGEKRDEKEEREKDCYVSERRFGSFSRAFQIPSGVDANKIEAQFAKGVLTVKMPKSSEAMKAEKNIAIKAS